MMGAVRKAPETLPVAQPSYCPLLRLANLCLEEPDALIGHVRICGGSGQVTARFYPARRKKT